MAKKKARTPPPPRRVQAPQQRAGKRAGGVDEGRARLILYSASISGVVMLAAVLAVIFVFHVGRDSSSPKVSDIGLPADCHQKLYKLLPGNHVLSLNATVKWNSFPPTSGPHYTSPAAWNFYTDPINPRLTLHNLEHGGIDIFYGKKVPQSQVQQIQNFWQSSPNGILVAPMPKPDKHTIVPRPIPDYSKKIVLAAWTAAAYSSSSRLTKGHGYMLTCGSFHQQTFKKFRDAHRGKGPERFPVSSLTPGS